MTSRTSKPARWASVSPKPNGWIAAGTCTATGKWLKIDGTRAPVTSDLTLRTFYGEWKRLMSRMED